MSKLWQYLCIGMMLISTVSVLAQEVTEPDDAPLRLDNYTADESSLLLQLEILGLIPSGAQGLFNQSNLNFGGDDAQFSNFALDNDASNLVMGAVLNFVPQSDELEFCGLAA